MASLTNPSLKIELISGTNNAKVTGTIKVGFTAFEKFNIEHGVRFRLYCRLVGDDAGFNGGDDDLYLYPRKTLTAGGVYTFAKTLSRNTLDEDSIGEDEVYARFRLVSTEPSFPVNITKESAVISGDF